MVTDRTKDTKRHAILSSSKQLPMSEKKQKTKTPVKFLLNFPSTTMLYTSPAKKDHKMSKKKKKKKKNIKKLKIVCAL